MADEGPSASELEALLKLPLDELKALPDGRWNALAPEHRQRLGQRLLDLMPPDERERAQSFARVRNPLIHELGEALGAYAWMLTSRDFGEAFEWAERLSLQWREVGERQKLEQLGPLLLPEETMQLLGALQSSFVLASSAEQPLRKLALEEREFGERTMLAGAEGVWANWEEVLQTARLERRERDPGVDDLKVEAPKRVSGRLPTPARRKRLMRARELSRMLEDELGASAEFYTETLVPDGHELTPVRATGTRERLEAIAACSRMIDQHRYAWGEDDWAATKLALAELRSIESSLVLALSADPARREKAASSEERSVRLFMLAEMSAGASREQAYDKLLALQEAGA